MPLVSVIIPTYNHRDYVVQTLESVFAQSFADFEVIIVNDGSPDDTSKLLRPIAGSGRIRYIEQSNAGQAAARNRGLAEAQGDFIAFLDDDDLWPVGKLQRQLDLIRQTGADVVVGACLRFSDRVDQGEIWRVPDRITCESLFSGNPIVSPGQTIISRVVLREVGGLDPSIWGTDDWDLWFKLSRRCDIVVSDEVELHYRLHATNASKNVGRMFSNARRVLENHIMVVEPSRRDEVRKVGYRTLFEWYGMSTVIQAKGELRRLNIAEFAIGVQLLWPLVSASFNDRYLFRRICGALLPWRQTARIFHALCTHVQALFSKFLTMDGA